MVVPEGIKNVVYLQKALVSLWCCCLSGPTCPQLGAFNPNTEVRGNVAGKGKQTFSEEPNLLDSAFPLGAGLAVGIAYSNEAMLPGPHREGMDQSR